ncbi:CGNR zinc finger domain-containing protein [Fodinicola feengrottensis]|uniref:CGNR zinc finger domain-containing protein n=1 Tax=Fodinicola feengrottensis TaxID=435914 RepID=A0ABN2FYL8_9ACTN
MELEGGHWLECESGGLWLDLLITVRRAYGPTPHDRLGTAELLGKWFAREGLSPVADPTEADLRWARDLREALRSLALATFHSQSWPAADLALLNRALADDHPLVLEGAAVRAPATAREALARIARQAAEHLGGPMAADLGQCGDPDCGMLFLDPTGRRKWCLAQACGVRHRVRAYRERHVSP